MLKISSAGKLSLLLLLFAINVWADSDDANKQFFKKIAEQSSWHIKQQKSSFEYFAEQANLLIKSDDEDSYLTATFPVNINQNQGRWISLRLKILELDEQATFIAYFVAKRSSGREVALSNREYTQQNVGDVIHLTDYLDSDVDSLEVVLYTWGKGKVRLKPLSLVQGDSPPDIHKLPRQVSAWLTEAWDITKRNWMFRNEDNAVWMERLLFTNLDKDSTVKQTRENWKQLIRKFDNHSFYHEPKQTSSDLDEPTEGNASIKYPDVVVEDSIGYIDMPSYKFLVDNASEVYGSGLQSNIFKAIPEVECGWIVDLRNNRGGDGQGPVFGLTPLLTYGTVLNFVHPDRKVAQLKISDKGLSVQLPNEDKSTLIIPTDDYFKRRFTKPLSNTLAVLTSAKSASAAEMIQITLMGESNVKSFGEKTAGYTTANEGFEMSDGTMLVLATTWLGDRNGKIYPDGITPDVPTALNLAKTKAKQWLLQECQK